MDIVINRTDSNNQFFSFEMAKELFNIKVLRNQLFEYSIKPLEGNDEVEKILKRTEVKNH